MDRGLSQYLQRHAEPEAKFADVLDDEFSLVLVAPLHRELASCIDGYISALAGHFGKPLLVLVVNSPVDASADGFLQTEQLLDEAIARTRAQEVHLPENKPQKARCFLGETQQVAVLVIDRCTFGRRIPEKMGTGLARKIGNDVAVGLFELGRLASRVVFQTDGDVTLPPDFFEGLKDVEPASVPSKSAVSAWAVPFTHVEGEAHDEYLATLHYEIRLRYHLFGLRHAACSYAWHSIGSAMAVEIYHYAAARGFPRRLAGEDFHLLNKLSKLGAIENYPSSPVRIRARRSDRVPFGTGPAVERLLEHAPELHDFRIFEVLGRGNAALAALAGGVNDAALKPYFVGAAGASSRERGVIDREWQVTQAAWEALGVWSSCRRAVRGAPPGPVRSRRVRDCFDGLKTLRFLHRVRDELYPDLPWREALDAVPSGALRVVDGESLRATLEQVRRELVVREMRPEPAQ